ncbi:apolipoprotein D-like [Bacillus rossius redtenbacheri]|uniref:apolipoprotein D-like n=1 Tax=Bacillus rossius redtenbacheri TaxID=93214 RepID=UPI002FDCF779
MTPAALLLLLCAALGWEPAAASQVYRECPDKPVLQHFDPLRFQGPWYELRRQPNLFEPNSVCVTGNVSVAADGTIAIVNKWRDIANSKNIVLDGVIRRERNTSEDGKMTVNFSYNGLDTPYWVLGTDYVEYAVVWSCMLTGTHEYTGYAWVLGRSKELGDAARDAVHEIEQRAEVDTSLYEDTRHEDCPALAS